MNHADFARQLDRIVEVYGDKYYPTPRVEIIFKWAQRISTEQLEAIVSRLIAECERPPLLQKFKDVYQELGFSKAKKEIECIYCVGSGFILDEKFLAYRCRCFVGESMPKYIKQWQGMLIRNIPTDADLAWHPARRIMLETINKKNLSEII